MANLEIDALSHCYGSNRVLQDIDLRVDAGQVVSLVGPSGCGKSTLLRAILGTHPPTKGTVRVGGKPVTGPTRDVGIVYQHYSLFDFLTARKNVAFGPMLDQTTPGFRLFNWFGWRQLRREHLAAADELLRKVGLYEIRHNYPANMSGGQRQRVAIAQALIMEPRVLLLDEPFGALDEATREELQLMLLNLSEENRAARGQGRTPPYTVIIVTHELNEALFVADRVLGLSQYHAEGSAGATIVYDKPAPVFRPGEPKDVMRFAAQKEELIAAVFDEGHLQDHREYVTFWEDHEKQAATA